MTTPKPAPASDAQANRAEEAMTNHKSDTPCLPECWKDHKPGPFQGFVYHATGCPRAPGEVCWHCNDVSPRRCCGTVCCNCKRAVFHKPEPKQGSEEPIDWEKAELWAAGTAQGDARLSQVQAARAFIALRAEVERLKKLHSDHCSNPICEGPRS